MCHCQLVSGHGDQIPNEDGAERDGWDEVILPLDWLMDYDHLDPNDRKRYVPSGIIIDDVGLFNTLFHVP